MNTKFTQILSLLVGLLVLSTSALYAQPANNECSGAIDISALFDGNTNSSAIFDNTGATNEASDPIFGFECFGEATPSVENSIWFTFVGDGNPYTITTNDCGSSNYIAGADAQIATYSGTCGGLSPVANGCNEDGPGASPGNWFSEVTFETVSGTTYYMLVDGFQAASGEFCLVVAPGNLITECEAGTMLTTGVVQVMGPTETFTLEAEGIVIPNSPTQGQLAWYFDNTNTDGSGALGGPFWLPVGTADEVMYNRDLNGALTNGGFPPFAGTWEVTTRVWSDATTTTTTQPCDTGDGMLTVLFDAAPIVTECEAGELTTTGAVQVIGDIETFTVAVDTAIVPNSPTQGQFAWYFDNSNTDGSGALGGPFWINTATTAPVTWNRDLNGTLSNNGFPVLAGTWEVSSRVWSDESATQTSEPCDTSAAVLTVLFDPIEEITACNAGVLTSTAPVDVPVGGTFSLVVNNDTVPNTPTEGSYGYFLTPINGGSGGLGGEFIIFTNSATNVYDNSLSGILANDPPLAGEWVFRGTVFADVADPFNTVCSQTTDSLIVNFEAEEFPCAAGSFFTTETQIVCAGEQATIGVMNNTDSIPQGGGFGWIVDDAPGGTGLGGAILLIDAPTIAAYNNTLGGASGTLEGAFSFRSAVYTNNNDPVGTICAISTDSVLVIYGEDVDLQIIEDGLELTAFPGVNFMDFTYAWSTGDDTQVITVASSGDYSVTITDGIGCTTEASTVIVSTNEAAIVNNLSVSPNPTSGLLNIALDLPASKEVQLSVIDITGKEVMNLAPVTFTSRNFEVDLQDQAAGLYLLRFRIGDEVVTRRVVKN